MPLLGGSMRRWGVRRAAPRAGKSCFRLAPRWLTRLCRLPGRTDSGRHSQAGASQDAREAAGQGGESGAARALAAQRAAQGAADALVRRDGRPAARRGQGTRPCVARPGAGADAARAGPELATVGTFAWAIYHPAFDPSIVSWSPRLSSLILFQGQGIPSGRWRWLSIERPYRPYLRRVVKMRP